MANKSQMPKAGASAGGQGKAGTARPAQAKAGKGKQQRYRAKSGNPYLIWWLIGGVVLVVAGILILNWQTLFGGSATTAAPRVSAGTTWGPESAPVTVVEYSNFGCSHCRDFALDNGPKLRKEYEAGGKVRFAFKQFRLADPTTTDAANAALCAADQGRFWDYHDRLFQEQGKSASSFSKSALKQYGAALGLDAARFNPCVDNDQRMAQVNQDSQEGVGKGVTGTPTFFVEGKEIVGNVPYEELKAAVEAAIKAKSG